MTEDNNDQSEDELKPEERMPDYFNGDTRWVKDIEYEKIFARVERFKEKTGFSDEQVEAILDGGNYKITLEFEEDHEFFYEMKEAYGLGRDEFIDEARRVGMLVLSNDKTIEHIDKIKQEIGFTNKQIVKMIKGAGEYVETALEEMTDDISLSEYKQLKEVGGMSTEEIANELDDVITKTGYTNGAVGAIDTHMSNLCYDRARITPEEQDIRDTRAYLQELKDEGGKKDPLDFLKDIKPRKR